MNEHTQPQPGSPDFGPMAALAFALVALAFAPAAIPVLVLTLPAVLLALVLRPQPKSLAAAAGASVLAAALTARWWTAVLAGTYRIFFAAARSPTQIPAAMEAAKAYYLSHLAPLFLPALPAALALAALAAWAKARRASSGAAREAPARVSARALRGLRNPPDGVALGLTIRGKPMILTWRQLNQHALVVGSTGSGKTNTLLDIASAAANSNVVSGALWVDGKGDPALIRQLRSIIAGDSLKVFAPALPEISACWDPLARGTATQRADKLVAAEAWESQFYLRVAQRFLVTLFSVCDAAGVRPTLAEVQEACDAPQILRQLAERSKDEKLYRQVDNYVMQIDEDPAQRSGIVGFGSRLAVLTASDAGPFLAPGPGAIDLARDLAAGKTILFLLPSQDLELRKILGNWAIQDLRTSLTELAAAAGKTYLAIFDEFSAYGSEGAADIVARSRSAGVCAVISTQEIADFAAVSKTLADQILGNTAVKIIHRQDAPASAEMLAKAIGTRAVVQYTYQTQSGLLGHHETGLGSAREVDEYIVHPQILKALAVGQAVVAAKVPQPQVEVVTVKPFQPVERR